MWWTLLRRFALGLWANREGREEEQTPKGLSLRGVTLSQTVQTEQPVSIH